MAIFDARYRTVTESYEDVNIDDILPNVDTSNVPDNFDEAVSGILYSNERNWNMLMQTVGIAELSCMESEGDVIYEAADIKAFFKKIGDFFKSVLDKIAGFFRKIVEKVQEWFFSIKKKMNEKKFKDLTQVPTGFKYEGYNFIDGLDKYIISDVGDITNLYSAITEEITKTSDDELNDLDAKIADQLGDPKSAKFKSMVLEIILDGVKIKDDNVDISKEIFKYFRSGKDKPEEITNIDIDKYKNTINTNLAVVKRTVAKDYKNVQDMTKSGIKDIEKKINSNKFDGLTERQTSSMVKILNLAADMLKVAVDLSAQAYSGQLKALHDQSKQYYGALVKMLSSSKSSSEEKKDDKKEGESQTESFGFSHSILDNVSFI